MMQTMHLILFKHMSLLNNKESCGMTKDEPCGRIVIKIVGLRSKLYPYKMFEGEDAKQ